MYNKNKVKWQYPNMAEEKTAGECTKAFRKNGCPKHFGKHFSLVRVYIIGTVVKRLKLYNRLIVNVIENSYLCVGKKNTSNRPRKAEFGGIAKINLHGKGTKFLRNITGSSVHRV